MMFPKPRGIVKIGKIGRQKFLLSAGILFAFLVCAINLSMLTRRTSGGGGGRSSSNASSSPDPSLNLPNENANLHPELNQTKVDPPRFAEGKVMLEGKHDDRLRTREFPPLPPIFNESGGMNTKTTFTQNIAWAASCEQLVAHENGHWQHHFPSKDGNITLLNDRSTFQMYFPEEMLWLAGRDIMPQGFGKCTGSNNFFMYNSIVGHQCGCGVTGFVPSHSVWMHNKTITKPDAAEAPPKDYFASSPTLRLARQLANLNDGDGAICFSGDSIDYQIYAAFHNNLRRLEQLHQLHHPGEERIVSVVTREIPVTHKYHTKPGKVEDWFLHGHRPPNGDGSFLNARRPPANGFGSMYTILETKAMFVDNGKAKKARIRYYMSYEWSPWNVEFMEDCDVNIMNIGLHYKPDGNHTGRETRHTLMDDMLAAITYLTNWTASKDNRIALWRSALPQHFSTKDGHFYGWKKLNGSCTAIGEGNDQQAYNRVYDAAFSRLCQLEEPTEHSTKHSCNHLRHSCSVSPAAGVDYQTIYKFWSDNNCTEHISNELLRLSNFSSVANKEASVTGEIFRWDIFDLFDVTSWHSKDLDCSHVCYIPQLFEAAFKRLELLVSPLIASF